jgi:hypothetical protein
MNQIKSFVQEIDDQVGKILTGFNKIKLVVQSFYESSHFSYYESRSRNTKTTYYISNHSTSSLTLRRLHRGMETLPLSLQSFL